VTQPRILIVGGGFAGLWAARTLGRMAIADVTLVDRRATSDFLPLANGRGCGSVMGLPVQGPPAAWLHYLLCAYRSWTWPSRRRILRGMIG